MPDMDRISPLPPFGARTCCCLPAAALSRGFSGPQRRIQSIFQSFFWGRGWLPGKPHCCPRAARRPGAPSGISQISADFWKPLPAGRKLLSSRSGLFVFHPDRNKLLCNIQEVTFIRLDSIYKIKSMEKQILVLDGKCWH